MSKTKEKVFKLGKVTPGKEPDVLKLEVSSASAAELLANQAGTAASAIQDRGQHARYLELMGQWA